MEANGDIYLDNYAGWYSVRDEAYYAEDETDGRRRQGARVGPQGTPVEWVEEESYFFRLSAYQDKLLDLYDAHPGFRRCRRSGCNEVASFVQAAACRTCRSRAPPSTGACRCRATPKHVMYVWVDALTNYITGVGFPDTDSEKFKRYWPADLHVIGKDIVRFHAVYWPAFLMSAGHRAAAAASSPTASCSTAARRCRSRSATSIDPFALVDAYGVDQVRYFFLREVPFGQDGNYSHEAIVNRINADLANDLGNLAQRSLSMIAQELGGVLPAPGAFTDDDKAMLAAADAHDRQGARGDEDAAAAPGAQRGLGGGRRRQPLFRRRGALGAGQDRSGAAGHGALRHRRGDPAGRDPGAAVHAGIGGEAARSAGRAGRTSASFAELGGGQRLAAGQRRCRRRAPVFPRYVEPRSGARQAEHRCWSTATAISIFPTSPTSSTPWSRARGRPASAAW